MISELKSFGVYKLVGSPHYIASEIIKGYYCEKCDIWSLGIILYALLSALQPFDGKNDKKVIEISKKRYLNA
jgi:serine/threonine protein kinase